MHRLEYLNILEDERAARYARIEAMLASHAEIFLNIETRQARIVISMEQIADGHTKIDKGIAEIIDYYHQFTDQSAKNQAEHGSSAPRNYNERINCIEIETAAICDEDIEA
jgi:hypothetical protein